MGVILEEPKHKVLDPSPSLKTTGESSSPTLGGCGRPGALPRAYLRRCCAPPYRDGRFG